METVNGREVYVPPPVDKVQQAEWKLQGACVVCGTPNSEASGISTPLSCAYYRRQHPVEDKCLHKKLWLSK